MGIRLVVRVRGPCLVGSPVKRVVDGKLVEFHYLIILDNGGGELLVPGDKVQAMGIRHLLDRSEISKLLDRLKKASRSAGNWKQRTLDNLKLFTSGSASDLAEIVGSLSELRKTKVLTPSDRLNLERARKLLVCEISEVMGETKSAVADQLDSALKVREKRNEEAGTRSGSASQPNQSVMRRA